MALSKELKGVLEEVEGKYAFRTIEMKRVYAKCLIEKEQLYLGEKAQQDLVES